MMIMITWILSLLVICRAQQAFLMSTSYGFYNYRQTANIAKMYHQLKESGFTDWDIALSIPENIGCCEKNFHFGEISFHDGVYDNLNSNIEIDNKFWSMRLYEVFQRLRGKYHPYDLNKIKLARGKAEPLLIYLTGHGGDTYFKLRERQALLDEHFRKIIRDINRRHLYESIFVMSDSCSAITPFEIVLEDNFVALGSSSFGEKSISHGFDSEINSAKSDDFTFYVSEWLTAKDHKSTIKDLYQYLDFTKLKVHSKLIGNSARKQANIDHYVKRQVKIQKKKFRLKYP